MRCLFELDTLRDWEYKFITKYAKVGTIKPPKLHLMHQLRIYFEGYLEHIFDIIICLYGTCVY